MKYTVHGNKWDMASLIMALGNPSPEYANKLHKEWSRNQIKFPSISQHYYDENTEETIAAVGNTNSLIKMIRENTIGNEFVFRGPFGYRKSTYMDHTASGQPLKCIEDFIRDHVMPTYANTHTVGNYGATQTSNYRKECREIVRKAVGAHPKEDVVIFCGSGATSAIHKIVNTLIGPIEKNQSQPPTVFVGLFEHHSNILPWREIGANVIIIPETEDGILDIDFLEKKLQEASMIKGRKLIGSFSAASNVTGVATDDIQVTTLLHKYGAVSLWDYSAAAPHSQIIMNPITYNENGQQQQLAWKDAIFFSGHKFPGGPQTPGVLIAKNKLFTMSRPHGAGGGTVLYVTQTGHNFLKNTEEREEGGTPGIIESIRLGLLFKLRETIGAKNIVQKEAVFIRKVLADWENVPEIKVLGSTTNPRVPILAFMIEHLASGYYLHHSFVVALLNDLFGIQARGGCACAGPYGGKLLGIRKELIRQYETLLLTGKFGGQDSVELVKPGFVRISFTYFSTIREVEFVSEAVKMIAKHGWKLLPLYNFNVGTGEFRHYTYDFSDHQKKMAQVSYVGNGIKYAESYFGRKNSRKNSDENSNLQHESHQPRNFAETLKVAKHIFANAYKLSKSRSEIQQLELDSSVAHLRWFLLPQESQNLQRHPKICNIQSSLPFRVKIYPKANTVAKFYRLSIPGQIQRAWRNVEDYGGSGKSKLKDFGNSDRHGL